MVSSETSSSTSTAGLSGVSLRQKDKIYLLGYMPHQITGSKLPSNSQVLRSLFYNKRQVKLDTREAARLTVQEVLIFWEKARIRTKHMKDCIDKLEKLHEEWRKLQKNASRSLSEAQQKKVETFKSNLDDLFDIAHQDALKYTNEEDGQFLILQRQKGRPGCMGGVDLIFRQAEERKQKRKAAEMARLEKSKLKQNVEDEDLNMEFLLSSDSEEEVGHRSQGIEEEEFQESQDTSTHIPELKKRKYSWGSQEIITEKLSLLLDRCIISDRDAVTIVSATAEALGYDPEKLAISRSTIRVRRQHFRKKRAQLIKNRFSCTELDGAVLHWDGKLLSGVLNKENVKRLAVLISCGDEEQLIGVPKLENSMGNTQAKAVFSEVDQWGAVENIKAMCFDTTAVNTGRLRGTCVLLEQLFQRDLLYLACRHHIFELLLKAVFDCKICSTTGPQPDIFKRFQTGWSIIDAKKYKIGIDDRTAKFKVNNLEQISTFLTEQLQKHQPRDDYKEFLQLCLIFLGRLAPEKVSFRAPGAIHHARWMAKAIYSLKIFMFRDQFPLSEHERNGIRSVCLFIINIYVKPWFLAPLATMAPNLDLDLIKNIVNYKKIDKDISEKLLSKFVNHLWYLNPEQVAFAFFDETLDRKVKINMALKLLSFRQTTDDEILDEFLEHGRVIKAQIDVVAAQVLLDKEVDFFISPQTLNFFKRFNISTDFLYTDPEVWFDNEDFLKGQNIVRGLRVVNDTAERGVKLIQDLNTSITKDEEQKQYLLQVVAECRKLYPDTSKATLSKPLPKLATD